MANLNLPPFYVGQRVVCVNAEGNAILQKDKQYTVLAIKQCLSCKKWHVGFEPHPEGIVWTCCAKEPSIGIRTAYASRFAPLEERFISMAEVIKKEMPLVGAN